MKTPEELRGLLAYDAATGTLVWKDVGSVQRRAKYSGKLAFTADDAAGYRQGRIAGVQYKAHRVIWAIVYGQWPKQVDHINGNRSDNRLVNLREATPAQNAANRKAVRGASKHLGVSWHAGASKWVAYVQKNGRQHYLGLYEDEAAAARAYRDAARRLHGHFAAV